MGAVDIRDLTIDNSDDNENIAEEIDFASFETLPPLCQVTQLLERREVRLEMKRADRVPVQRELGFFSQKFIALPFQFLRQLKIWSFHVVVVQGQQTNVQ